MGDPCVGAGLASPLHTHHDVPFHMSADYLHPDHIVGSKAWTAKSSEVKTAGAGSSTSSSVLCEVIAEWLNHHDPKTEMATDLAQALKRVHSAPSNIPVPTLTPILVLLSGTSVPRYRSRLFVSYSHSQLSFIPELD